MYVINSRGKIMKKKLILSLLSMAMCASAIGVTVAVNQSDPFFDKNSLVSGTFVLDENSITEQDDYYTAVALDGSNNTVMAKFVGMELDSESHKLSFAARSAGWFANVDPVRGFDSISVSFDSTRQGYGAIYFSYNELNAADIFAGKYQDIFCMNITIYTETLQLTSDMCPQMLDARYVLFLFDNQEQTAPLIIEGLSFDSHCAAEPAPQEIGTVTNFRDEYVEMVEDAGLSLWSGFILGNGSYSLSVITPNPYMPITGYEITSIQDFMGVNTIVTKLYTDGYTNTQSQQEETMMVMYWQKVVGETVYTVAFNVIMSNYYILDIICTTDFPYIEQDTTWPTEKILAAGAPSDLVNAFEPLNLPNVTYMFQAKLSQFTLDFYLVSIVPSGGTPDVSGIVAALEAYKAIYNENSGYYVESEINQSTYSFTVMKVGTNYGIEFSSNMTFTNMAARLIELKSYDHLPLQELRESHGETTLEIIPSDIYLYGDFSYGFDTTSWVGTNISESTLKAFVDEYIDRGFIFAGSYDKGQILAPLSRMVYYNDRFDFQFQKVDEETYLFTINVDNYQEPWTVDMFLINFGHSSNAAEEIFNIARNSGSPLLNQQLLTYYSGQNQYHTQQYILKGVSTTAEADFMSMFNDERLEVTSIRDGQYKITILDSLDPGNIGQSIMLQFVHFNIGETRNMALCFAPDSYVLHYSSSYSATNAHVSSRVGSDYVYISSTIDKGYIYAASDDGFSTIGSFEEMNELYKGYVKSIEASGKYTYDEVHERYIANSGNKALHVTLTGYAYNMIRVDVLYSDYIPTPASFYTYSNSGLASCSFINDNFAHLPYLGNEKAYKIISESENEVIVAINNKFECHNYYVSKILTEHKFVNGVKQEGDYIYTIEEQSRGYENHTVYVFKKEPLLTKSDLLSEIGTEYLHIDEAVHLSSDWLYLNQSLYSGETSGELYLEVFNTSFVSMTTYFEALNIHQQEQFIVGDYAYSISYRGKEGVVYLEIYWERVSD